VQNASSEKETLSGKLPKGKEKILSTSISDKKNTEVEKERVVPAKARRSAGSKINRLPTKSGGEKTDFLGRRPGEKTVF